MCVEFFLPFVVVFLLLPGLSFECIIKRINGLDAFFPNKFLIYFIYLYIGRGIGEKEFGLCPELHCSRLSPSNTYMNKHLTQETSKWNVLRSAQIHILIDANHSESKNTRIPLFVSFFSFSMMIFHQLFISFVDSSSLFFFLIIQTKIILEYDHVSETPFTFHFLFFFVCCLGHRSFRSQIEFWTGKFFSVLLRFFRMFVYVILFWKDIQKTEICVHRFSMIYQLQHDNDVDKMKHFNLFDDGHKSDSCCLSWYFHAVQSV